MRDQIIEMIYAGWSDGLCGCKGDEVPEVQRAIDEICGLFKPNKKGAILVEQTIMEAVTQSDHKAFKQGFLLCLELLNGNLLANKSDWRETNA